MNVLVKCLILSQILLVSCISHQETVYFNDLSESEKTPLNIPDAPSVILQSNDILNIKIGSISTEANQYFNTQNSDSDSEFGGNSFQIKSDGYIELPLIGKVQAAGYTSEILEDSLKLRLKDYLKMPTVNVRVVNFKITVLGEVANPGVYTVSNGKINILQALGMAGDITVYGKRQNVLLIRDNGGENNYVRLNLNNSALITSEYYYLMNNDVVYIEPSKGKTAADDNFYRIFPILLSSLTFVAVVFGVVVN